MVKKFSAVALAGLLAVPAMALAQPADQLEQRIDALTKELTALKAQMDDMKEENEKITEEIDEKSEKWDLASRFELSGDFRARGDYLSSDSSAHYSAFNVADSMATIMQMAPAAGGMGFTTAAQMNQFFQQSPEALNAMLPGFATPLGMMTPVTPAQDYDNDTMFTNRMRLNMRVKATENVEFKGRLAMYKAWGMQTNPMNQTAFSPYQLSAMSFDGSRTRQPDDSALYVDRAFVNWNNIGGQPFWFSIGRRPTTDGPPEHLRLGADERLATPVAYMNYPFDGISVGYAYRDLLGLTGAPGRVRFCYGRGFESGLEDEVAAGNDTDFAGLSWDIYQKGNRFINIQAFGAFNMFNVPDNVTFPNPLEISAASIDDSDLIDNALDFASMGEGAANGILDRANLGDIYHTSAVYMDKWQNLNYFVAGGWSHTDPRGYDEMGNSLLKNWWAPLEEEDGFSGYVGVRYDMDNLGLKLGLEYNWGSEYWIGFTPGHDDVYSAKLATRGSVYEVYGIWDIPGGEAISKYGKAFIRLGYMHYDYDYTGSGFWLGAPVDMDELATSALNAQFYAPVDSEDQIYATFEAWF